MSEELYPYVRPKIIGHFTSLGFPAQPLRKEEMLKIFDEQITESLEAYAIQDLVDTPLYSEKFFDELVTKKILREEVEKYAGYYWRINSAQLKIWAGDFPNSDPISQAANRIGNRFYPDVFDGFRTQNGIVKRGEGAPIPNSVIIAQDWSRIASNIDENKKQAITSKVAELIETIGQSDLDPHVQANAIKRAESVALLLEAPDPPWETIVELLNNRYLQAFLSTLSIIQLIIGLAS